MDTAVPKPECPGCLAAGKKIASLEREMARLAQDNAQLRARLKQLEEHVEALSRAGKRQAAPFSRDVPKTDPQKPGRKPGPDYGTHAFRAMPEKIDEVYQAPLPEKCPHCGGTVFRGVHVREQYQVEIPRQPIYRQFDVAFGQCTCCGRHVHGRHPLQTSNAVGCCASQVGAEAQAAMVLLNKELGLSQGKISRFFKEFYGIPLSRGGSCQIMLRAAAQCEGHYLAIVTRVQQAPWLVPDETGWRIGGRLAWLHVAVTQWATAYLIARPRGKVASDLLLGEHYAGTLIHDGWSPYDQFAQAGHQTCLGHLSHRCRTLLEVASSAAASFPRQVQGFLDWALELRDQRDAGLFTSDACARAAGGLEVVMGYLLEPIQKTPTNERLARHLRKHLHQLFTFLQQPEIDATNYRAEQAIRPAVVNRKVWGGNRTGNGAVAQSILMSILVTLRQNGQNALEFFSRQLRSPDLLALPIPAG